jgi:hypothetical protein
LTDARGREKLEGVSFIVMRLPATFPAHAIPLALAALGGCGVGSEEHGGAECKIHAEYEPTPALPDGFDLLEFRDVVLPELAASCAGAGCHDPRTAAGGFAVWGDGAAGGCDLARSFNSFRAFTDDRLAASSRLLLAIDGAYADHPVSVPEGSIDATLVELLRDFIADALSRRPGGAEIPGASVFDYEAFQDAIMPMMDRAGGVGCNVAGCHDLESRAGGFALHREPARDSHQMRENFTAIATRSFLDEPARSAIYVRATQQHAAGTSTVLAAGEANALLAWIIEASTGNPPPPCADVSGFNLGVWEQEIFPILEGKLDLNTRGPGSGALCTAGPCHGTERIERDGARGKLFLDPGREPLENLENFACFVNLRSPVRSEILACPLNRRDCRHDSHPGGALFADTRDLNYQRLLSFIYSGNPQASPLDFAFFVHRINPIFDNPAASETGHTCSSLTCHGVAEPGDIPNNASSFPLLRHAQDPAALTVNFANTTAFTSFLSPEESSLFLYATNEIRNVFGFSHLGGRSFSPESELAEAILAWARGLRPDAEGFLRHWLVAGDYTGLQDARDATAVGDEATITPRIFQPSSGQRRELWDALLADGPTIELNEAFPRETSPGRAAYAVAYVLNATSRPVETTLRVESPHEVIVHFGDRSLRGAGGVASITLELEAYASTGALTRVMVKVFQPQGEPGPGFAFSARFLDRRGEPLTEETGELIFVLGPEGGI